MKGQLSALVDRGPCDSIYTGGKRASGTDPSTAGGGRGTGNFRGRWAWLNIRQNSPSGTLTMCISLYLNTRTLKKKKNATEASWGEKVRRIC